MESKETFEGNLIIKDWMRLQKDIFAMTFVHGEPEYHKDWNLLMPVVKKIDKLIIKFNITSNMVIFRVDKDQDNDIVVSYKNEKKLIDAAWQAVVQFVNYYNTQNKQQ